MAYTIHQTRAYVLRSTAIGEANRRLDLLSEELGLIRANAQGIRYLKSKLRYVLSDYALADVSLVRGKDYWRLVNAVPDEDIFYSLSPQLRMIFIKVFSLLVRLITGEHPEPDIFWLIRGAHKFAKDLNETEQVNDDKYIKSFESLIILRLLNLLGYVGNEEILKKYGKNDWNNDILLDAVNERKKIVGVINHALRESGL
jgi:recombinational DNA repair protein (RecF pathway)